MTSKSPFIVLGVRVALEVVRARLQGHRPRVGSGAADVGRLVDAGAGEVEVVDVGLIVHLDRVVAGGERRDVGAVRAGEADLEAGADARGERAADVAVVSVVVSLVVVVSVVVPEASSSLPPQPASATARTARPITAPMRVRVIPILLRRSTRRYVVPAVSVRSKVSHPMDVLEIAPGLWRWTAFHEEWNEDVGCVVRRDGGRRRAHRPARPLRRHREVLEGARPRRQARRRGRVHVFITVFWHARSAAEMRERYDARIWAPSAGKAAIARRAGMVTDRSRPAIRCRAVSRRTGRLGPPRSCTGSPSTRRSSRATS